MRQTDRQTDRQTHTGHHFIIPDLRWGISSTSNPEASLGLEATDRRRPMQPLATYVQLRRIWSHWIPVCRPHGRRQPVGRPGDQWWTRQRSRRVCHEKKKKKNKKKKLLKSVNYNFHWTQMIKYRHLPFLSICHPPCNVLSSKPGFHYPSWRPEWWRLVEHG